MIAGPHLGTPLPHTLFRLFYQVEIRHLHFPHQKSLARSQLLTPRTVQ
jgi:hypothetical protein